MHYDNQLNLNNGIKHSDNKQTEGKSASFF